MTNPAPLLPSPASMPKLAGKTKLRILAIDGGALRGVVPAQILSYFDGSVSNNQVNGVSVPAIAASVSGAFDLIVGTSAGGLVTAGLTVPTLGGALKSAADVVSLFDSNAQTIFPLQDDSEVVLLSQAMFDNVGLLSVIGGEWGVPTWLKSQTASGLNFQANPQTLGDAATSVMITSFNNAFPTTPAPANQINAQTPWGPVFLNNGTTADDGATVSVMQACLMTSAFPLLLPPVPYDLNFLNYANPAKNAKQVTTGNYFLDGGVWAGNPAFAAYSWAISNGFEVELLLSLGCGSYTGVLTAEESSTNYATAAQYGSGVVWAGSKGVLGNPGWLVTARDQVKMANPPHLSSVADESLLLSIMGAGAAGVTETFLNNAISNAGGVYVRIDPTLNLTDASGDTGPFAPYCSDTDVINGWRTDASNALTPAGKLLADWSTLQALYNS